MGLESVSSAADPRLDPFREVADPVRVRSEGRFVAEGRRVVAALLAAWPETVEAIVLTPPATAALADALARVAGAIPVYEVPGPAVLRRLTGVHFHQGCLALARRPAPRRVEEVVGAPTGPGLWLVLEGVTDPDNVGTLFRSGAAFGVRAVLIGPASAHPLYRKALRTSLGTVLGVPFAEAGDWEADLARLAAAGIERVALTPDATAPSLAEAVARAGPRVALLLGSEERGLSPGTLATAEIRARIPLAAEVDSLNVAAAGAIALYAFAAGGDDPGRGA